MELKEFKQMQTKTLENLEVGDLVVETDGDYKRILAKGQENGELTAYLVSYSSEDKNSDDLKDASSWRTAHQLKENNYKPVTEEETEELTVAQVCKELGRDIKIIK